MARRKRSVGGRPEGAESVVLDDPKYPYTYSKPRVKGGKWRVFRTAKGGGEERCLTLSRELRRPEPEDLAQAISDREELAKRDAGAAIPEEERPPASVTLGEAIDAYLAWVEKKRRPDTVASYRGDLRRFADAAGGRDRPLVTITAAEVSDWADRPEHASGRAKEKAQAAVTRLYRWAAKHRRKEKWIPRDHEILMDLSIEEDWKLEIKERLEDAPDPLNAQELRALLRACREPYAIAYKIDGRKAEKTLTPDPALYVAVALASLAGLRRRTLLELTWADVILEPVGEERFQVEREKLKRGRLKVPMASQLARILRAHRETVSPFGRDEKTIVEVDRFPYEGFRGEKDAKGKVSGGAVKRAGLLAKHPHLRLHDLRHTLGQLLDEAGASEGVFATLMGHSRGGKVSKRYRHADEKAIREVLARIPDVTVEAPREVARKDGNNMKGLANSGGA